MSSEPAERPRASPPSPAPAPGADQAKAKQAQVTDELRAMMRDVPISERLMQVLDSLEAEEQAKPAGKGPDQGER